MFHYQYFHCHIWGTCPMERRELLDSYSLNYVSHKDIKEKTFRVEYSLKKAHEKRGVIV